MTPKIKKHLYKDALIIVLSIVAAIFLVKTGIITEAIEAAKGMVMLQSFVAGLFFTFAFTTPLAIVALGSIALGASIWTVAFYGAIGAVIGDLVIFLFVKDRLAEDLWALVKALNSKKLIAIFHYRIFRFLTPFVGALIIASPLPDELGLAMMGLSRVSLPVMIPVSFVMNFIGIVIIGLVAKAL